ncbi:MAG TPA: hypothetical protein VLG76_01520 [Rhabdochlamydiaceae bacterium]|nr:hypothetical protein [Rhabdochlamydiaceae bacterium]HSX37577.1 hypothetical protein [Chlamydiales bacterium]
MSIISIPRNYNIIGVFNLPNFLVKSGVFLGITLLAQEIISKIPTVRGDFGGPDPEPSFNDYWTEREAQEARGLWRGGPEWGHEGDARSLFDFGNHMDSFGDHYTEQESLEARKPSGYAGFGEHVLDFAGHVSSGVVNARSGNWAGAAVDSMHVGGDAAELGQDVFNGMVESRADAVSGGYAQYSDIGFQ